MNPNLGYIPSRPTNGYVGGGLPLTLVTHQKPFRAATSQSVETPPPQSKTFPRDTQDASMPPRPPLFPQLPPRDSDPRRPSVRTNTDETLSPASESTSQSQPPNIIPTSHPPPTTGEDVGESATPPPSRHWSGYEYSHQYTADYSYRFDAIPSPPSDSGPSHYEPADISGGTHAHVWPVYNQISQKFDKQLFSKWNSDLDVLLIFVSLILVTALNSAETDANDTGRLVLRYRYYIPPHGPR